MSNRFSRPDDRSDLFSSYNRSASPSKTKNKPRPGAAGSSSSPYNSYGYTAPSSPAYSGSGSGAAGSLYPGGSSGSGYGVGGGNGGGGGLDDSFRSATPNSRGQYSAAVLDELESQNDEHVGVLTGKVRMLKDLTHLIGDEIRTSTTLAEKMNDQFENSRHKIRGTMNRMLVMAKKTGVGWKVWVGFFAAVILLFWWVWLG
ncbi:blocked early in transport 1 [Pyrenophora seminiperda CCB06]|uniref:Blocked early in transport 1 n=1 Tax=Pyrenophora seminiperda CCB06 TaxID=1302712 RepID=A0A3M7LY80_9PLEO|nr:blocked early in transport 1 [Pyrenophora seminiperda CCB06]